MTVQFDPGSWLKAAAVFEESGRAIGAVSPSMDAAGGATRTDAAVAGVVRRLMAGLPRAVSGLSAGLLSDGAGMRSTAANYSAQEAAGAKAATGIRQA